MNANLAATLSDKLGSGIKDSVSSAGSAVGSAASAADAASGGKISSGAEAAVMAKLWCTAINTKKYITWSLNSGMM
jgi:hypothetical protein